MRQSEVRNVEQLNCLRTTLKALMSEQKLTQAQLAGRANIPTSSLARIVSGEVQNPGIDVVVSLAECLGVSVGTLLGDTASPGQIALVIQANDRIGLLRDIASVIAEANVDIIDSTSRKLEGGMAQVALTINILNPHDLSRVLNNLLGASELSLTHIIGNTSGSPSRLQQDIDRYLQSQK